MANTLKADLMCSQRCLARWAGHPATRHSTLSHQASAGAPRRLGCQAHRSPLGPHTAARAQAQTVRSAALAEAPGQAQQSGTAPCLPFMDLCDAVWGAAE